MPASSALLAEVRRAACECLPACVELLHSLSDAEIAELSTKVGGSDSGSDAEQQRERLRRIILEPHNWDLRDTLWLCKLDERFELSEESLHLTSSVRPHLSEQTPIKQKNPAARLVPRGPQTKPPEMRIVPSLGTARKVTSREQSPNDPPVAKLKNPRHEKRVRVRHLPTLARRPPPMSARTPPLGLVKKNGVGPPIVTTRTIVG